MTVEEFEASDGKGFDGALLALWWDAKGEWEKAHGICAGCCRGGWGLGACLSASQGWGPGECNLLV
jgi:hypothetical protein